MDIVVERREEQPPVVHITAVDSDSLTVVEDAFELGRNAGLDAPIWLHGTTAEREIIFRDGGYESNRTLFQLRICLRSTIDAGLPTRPFTEADIGAVVRVNNRAFDWHPEQSGKEDSWLLEAMAAPWFDADGFRLFELDDRLAGFCWTKIHDRQDDDDDDADGDRGCRAEVPTTKLGEIFVIALDPDFVGRGLGGPLTLSGLNWLAGRGLDEAMLFVESDNHAALAIYEKLGFSRHRTDRLWRRAV